MDNKRKHLAIAVFISLLFFSGCGQPTLSNQNQDGISKDSYCLNQIDLAMLDYKKTEELSSIDEIKKYEQLTFDRISKAYKDKCSSSIYFLGLLYRNGIGTKKDLELAQLFFNLDQQTLKLNPSVRLMLQVTDEDKKAYSILREKKHQEIMNSLGGNK